MYKDFSSSISAVQFMSEPGQFWVARIIDREAAQDREFARLLDDAKRMADEDQARYDAWLCQQAAEREAASMEDVPW